MNKDLEIIHNELYSMLCDLDDFCKENNIQYVLAYGTALGCIRHGSFIPWDDDLDVQMTRENYEKFLKLFKNNEKYFLQKSEEDYPLYFSKLRKNNTTFIEDVPYRKKYKNIHQGIFIDIFPIDKVSSNKFYQSIQIFYSNILISLSLFLRGYKTNNLLKKVYMVFSLLFYPFRKKMISFIEKFNSQNTNEYSSFFGETKKVYIKKEQVESLIYKKFGGGGREFPLFSSIEEYLKRNYGDWKKLPTEEQKQAKIHAKIFCLDKNYSEFLK